MDRFLGFSLPRAFTAESLAVELAKRTRFMRDIVARQLADERDAPGSLTGFYEAFQQYLIGNLTVDDFARPIGRSTPSSCVPISRASRSLRMGLSLRRLPYSASG